MKARQADVLKDLASDVEGLNQLVTWQQMLVREVRNKVAALQQLGRPQAAAKGRRRGGSKNR